MNIRLKLLPVIIMLIAGAATSIITFLIHYDSEKAMWILLGVLVLFYILGIVLQKILNKFETQIAEEEARLAEEEGIILDEDGNIVTVENQDTGDEGEVPSDEESVQEDEM